MDIEFDGAYDRAAFAKGLALFDRRSTINTIIQWALPLLLVFTLGMGINDWLKEGAQGASLPARLGQPALLAVLTGYYYLAPRLARRGQLNRIFKDGASRRMKGRVGPEGITLEPTAGGEVRFRWEQFIRRRHRDPLLALIMRDGTMAYFQRDFFKSEADWTRFVELTRRRVIDPRR